MKHDILRRFILDNVNIRGEWVHLDKVWHQLQERADYPPLIRAVLGEALAAAALLSATVKHSGSLILQIRSDGPVHLLVVQATPDGALRGLAQWTREPEDNRLQTLFGDGQMVITLESADTNERYQGIIALEGETLAEALEQYFARSEQLPTRLWLTADQHSAAGMLLQRLPTAETADGEQKTNLAEDWSRVSILLDTLTRSELLQLAPEQVILRLFHEEEPRLFAPKPLRFQCSCSLEKIANMIRSLGETEANAIIEEQGSIEVNCEFCNAHYQFDPVDVKRLFTHSTDATSPTSPTIH